MKMINLTKHRVNVVLEEENETENEKEIEEMEGMEG